MTRTVLITGASSGIGLASAIAAAHAGWTTIATVRERARAAALHSAGVPLDIVALELTDPTSIADCMKSIMDRHGRLDALVNNAGVAGTNPTCELSDMAHLRATMEVNFFGVVAMSRAALPHLRASHGRLITISSVRGVIGQPFNEGYSAAKFAVEGFMEGLAPVAARVGVAVSLIEPAAVLDTRFVDSSPDDVATMLDPGTPYEPAFRAYRRWVRTGAVEGAQCARDVADVVVRTLAADRPPFRIQTSEYGRRYVSRKLADPDGSLVQALTSGWISEEGGPREPPSSNGCGQPGA